MIHSPIGLVHTIAAVIALLSGALIFIVPKAGRKHRKIGYVYVGSMVIVIITAFLIYRLTASFNFLHVAALVSFLTLGKGMWHVIQRRPEGEWFDQHYTFMIWSYVGLVAAFIAETATRVGMPVLHGFGVRSFGWFWTLVGLTTTFVVFVSIALVRKNKSALGRYRPKSAKPAHRDSR